MQYVRRHFETQDEWVRGERGLYVGKKEKKLLIQETALSFPSSTNVYFLINHANGVGVSLMRGLKHHSTILALPSIEIVSVCLDLNELYLLRSAYHMASLEASSNAGTRIPSCILNIFSRVVLGIADYGIQSRLYKAPATSIKRLLLGPDDFLHVGILVQLVAELRPREGV